MKNVSVNGNMGNRKKMIGKVRIEGEIREERREERRERREEKREENGECKVNIIEARLSEKTNVI